MVKGKTKGSARERQVARILEKWVGGKLWRTPASQGIRGQSYGDIWGQDERGMNLVRRFLVEVKSRRKLNLFMKSSRNEIMSWWNKAEKEAAGFGVDVMLVFCIDFVGVWVVVKNKYPVMKGIKMGEYIEWRGLRMFLEPWEWCSFDEFVGGKDAKTFVKDRGKKIIKVGDYR